jgi:hypothetical protein
LKEPDALAKPSCAVMSGCDWIYNKRQSAGKRRAQPESWKRGFEAVSLAMSSRGRPLQDTGVKFRILIL